MLKNYLVFDFGESFYKDKSVIDLIIEKLLYQYPWIMDNAYCLFDINPSRYKKSC